MLTHEAFLSDIVDHPNDDTPRLVYADWLDDQDNNLRAELIRAQCRLALLAPGDEHRKLSRRVSELLLNEGEWIVALPQLEGVRWEDFSRGFVEGVFVDSVETFLKHAEAMFKATPVRRLRIGSVSPNSMEMLSTSPWLDRLSELNISNLGTQGPGLSGMRSLARSPRVGQLTALLLHYNALGEAAVCRLVESPHFLQLRELYLSGNDLQDRAAHALSRATGMPRLTDLDLRDNNIGDDGMQALAYSEHRRELATLYLVNNRISTTGAEALAWTQQLPNLTRLYLNYNLVGNAGAFAFAESPQRTALTELDLRHCDIRDNGARALAASPNLQGLRMLWLSGNRLRMETLSLLRRRFGDRVVV